MENKLYIDNVSKTIISALSSEITGRLINELQEYNKHLLLEDLPAVISQEIKEQEPRLDGRAKALEEKMHTLVASISSDIKALVSDAVGGLARSAEDRRQLTAQELKGVAQSILDGLREHHGLLKDIINSQTDDLNEKIENVVTGSLNTIEKNTRGAEDRQDLIKQELKVGIQSIQDGLQDQHERLKATVEKQALTLGDKIADAAHTSAAAVEKQARVAESLQHLIEQELKGSVQSLQDGLRDQHELLKTTVEQQSLTLGGKIADAAHTSAAAVEKQARAAESLQHRIEQELKGSVQSLQDGLQDQHERLKGIIVKQTDALNEKFENSIVRTVKAMETNVKIDDELKEMLTGELAGITKLFQESTGQQGDLINTVLYAVKKQASAYSKERDESDSRIAGLLAALQEVQRTVADSQEKLIKFGVVQNDSTSEIQKSMSKLSNILNGSAGPGDDLISLMESRTKCLLDDFRGSLAEVVANVIDTRLSAEAPGEELIRKEFATMTSQIQDRGEEQGNLLNSIYYATKKLSNALGDERDTSQSIEIQLVNALDVLYRHIRRLEAEKDDRGVELLRLGGDTLQKEKLAKIEDALKTQEKRAETALREKNEIEEKMRTMQELWEKAVVSEEAQG